MTIAENDGRIELLGDGTEGPFTVDFKIDDKSEVLVQVGDDVKTVDIDYELDGIGNSTFDVIFLEPFPEINANIVVTRNQKAQNLSVYTPNEGQATVHERLNRDFDKVAKFNQMALEIFGRCLKFANKSLFRNVEVDDPINQRFSYYDAPSGKIKWGIVTSIGTLISPVPIIDGGTGVAAASLLALRDGIGLTKDSTGRAALDAAPNNASYLVVGAHGELTTERIVTAGSGISFVDGGAGQPFTISSTGTRGYKYGGQFTNNAADATNDIDITACECASDDVLAANRVLLVTPAMTKQLDAVWAAGSAAGGRIATEALADGTWFGYQFRRSGGSDDICFSQLLNPTLPDGGTKKRMLWVFLREGGIIVPLNHHIDTGFFERKTPLLGVNDPTPGILAKVGTLLGAPTGIALTALVNAFAGNATYVYLSSLATVDMAPSDTVAPLFTTGNGGTRSGSQARIRLDTSRQFRYRAGVDNPVRIVTLGWFFNDRNG